MTNDWFEHGNFQSIMNHQNLIYLLNEIALVLDTNGHPGQAKYVSALATVAEWDDTAVVPGLKSGAMWGGSGSVFDVAQFNSKDDRRKFLKLLLQLIEEMRKRAITTDGADFAAKVIRSWIESGIV
jgi:hypothetical protein